MQVKLVWFLVQIAPVVTSLIGLSAISVCASEALFSTASSTLVKPVVQLPQIASSPSAGVPEEIAETIGHVLPLVDAEAIAKNNVEWQVSDSPIIEVDDVTEAIAIENTQLNQTTTTFAATWSPLELEQLTSNYSNLDGTQSTQSIASEISGESSVDSFADQTESLFVPIVPSEVSPLTPRHRQIAQDETPLESDSPETAPEPEATTSAPEETTSAPRWQFTLTPYGFVPLSVDGSATIGDFTADVDLGLDDVLNPLNFAAAGRVEAWRGSLGFIFDGAYFSISQEKSTTRSVPDCLCEVFPSKIDTEVDVQYGQFDLGVGYRMAANTSNAATEFDLGPLVFDAIAGLRIYAIQQEINLSTNIDTERNLERNGTLVTPMVSGRLRWNLSPTLAGWVRGDIAGFGIGGTLMAASVTGGLDWMFSGNTSLLLAYRLSSLQYTTDVQGEEFELNLLMQGPYMGIVFRF